MSTVQVTGPFTWVQPAGANGLLPGESHVWSWVTTGVGVVLAVSAHPSRQYTHQALAITDLSTAYGSPGTGPAAVNYKVKNVSDTGVLTYRKFIAEIGL